MDREEFRNQHGGETFHVDPEFGERWDGHRNDRIAECVMMQAVVSVDEAGDRIAFLRDAGLPESSGSDNRSEGDEPSSLFEVSMNENGTPHPSRSSRGVRRTRPGNGPTGILPGKRGPVRKRVATCRPARPALSTCTNRRSGTGPTCSANTVPNRRCR